mgnify:FL=1
MLRLYGGEFYEDGARWTATDGTGGATGVSKKGDVAGLTGDEGVSGEC